METHSAGRATIPVQTARRRTRKRNSRTPVATTQPMPPKLASQTAGGIPTRLKYSIMLALPANQATKATTAAAHHGDRSENQKRGSGANHMSGHHGVNPLPNQTNTAVAAKTATAVTNLPALLSNSIYIPR